MKPSNFPAPFDVNCEPAEQSPRASAIKKVAPRKQKEAPRKATKNSEAQAFANRQRDNSLCCETVEVFYRDLRADRLSYLPHLFNVVRGIHLLDVHRIDVFKAKRIQAFAGKLGIVAGIGE